MTTCAEVLSRAALGIAWNEVLVRDAQDGRLSPSIQRFALEATKRLDALATVVATGDYAPAGMAVVRIPKRDGSYRGLDIPAVQDRIVERALLAHLAPLFDRLLGPFSYAYR